MDGFVGAPVDPGAPAAGPSDGELDLLGITSLPASLSNRILAKAGSQIDPQIDAAIRAAYNIHFK